VPYKSEGTFLWKQEYRRHFESRLATKDQINEFVQAAGYGDLDAVLACLGVDEDENDWAIMDPRAPDAAKKSLLNGRFSGPDEDAHGKTALSAAFSCSPIVRMMSNGDIFRVVDILIAHGADINMSTYGGDTSLNEAAEAGDLGMVTCLLHRYHADIDALGEGRGETALARACREAHQSVVEVLLERHASVDKWLPGNKASHTPLINACYKGSVPIVTMLLDARASIDQRCVDGVTALYMAAAALHTDVMEVLLERGSAAIDTPCTCPRDGYSGCSPLRVAREQGDTTVEAFLVRWGALDLGTFDEDASGIEYYSDANDGRDEGEEATDPSQKRKCADEHGLGSSPSRKK
jgi:ankyrin repeat protein